VTLRAAVYCRVSDDRLGTRLGVARQEQDCRDLVERQAWEVAEAYVDNDMSAFGGKDRPGYRRVLADIEHGRIDVIVACAHGPAPPA
jgi:DNA invertase Pin-like site-specific DNA recombinase